MAGLTNEAPPSPELPVIAGMDVLVYQNSRLVGWATDAGFDEDFHLEPINTLGRHGPRGHKSTNYSATVNIGAFVLSANEADNFRVPTRQTIPTEGLTNFQFIEKETGVILYEMRQCKCATHSVNIDQSLSRRTTRWEATEIIPINAF